MSNEDTARRLRRLMRISTVVMWGLVAVALIAAWQLRSEQPASASADAESPANSGSANAEATDDSGLNVPRLVIGDPRPAGANPYLWSEDGIEDFSLTDQLGRTVTRDDLLGKHWAACFIFTQCAGPMYCPRVTQQFRELQDRLAGTDVKLVSFTVDPKNDTPEVLASYAATHGADPERWHFLTGDQYAIYGLIHRSFRMPVQEVTGPERVPGFQVIHTTNVVHVDPTGRIVGKYNAQLDSEMAELRKELRAGTTYEEARAAGRWDSPEEAAAVEPRLPLSPPAAAGAAPEWVLQLPAVNAGLNGLATLLLVAGYAQIKAGRRQAHAAMMLAAFGVSIAFLATYLTYHVALDHYTGSGSRPFTGTGPVRSFYLGMLASHIVLAAIVPILALVTIYRGWRRQWERHRWIARLTLPIWLYVSVTGVMIYGMLYHWPVG